MTAMPATDAPRRMTVEEFLAVPESEPGRWELIDGEVVVSDPTFLHQQTATNLLFALETWRRAADRRGVVNLPVDTAGGPDTIVAPDLQWWSHGRDLPDPTTRPYPLGDLVVEVRSPSTWAVDVGRKRAIYEREGVRELWLVDPLSQTVLVFARSSAAAAEFDVARDLGPGDALTSPLLPEFSVGVAELFAS